MIFSVRYKAQRDPTGAGEISVICDTIEQARDRFQDWAKANGLKNIHAVEIVKLEARFN
jgi:hypothetical protein